VEPYWLDVTRYSVAAGLEAPVKIAHLADLHARGLGRRERALLTVLEREAPALIVLTGDQLVAGGWGSPPIGAADDHSHERAAELLSRLRAPLGVWAVRGNWDNWRGQRDDREYYGSLGITLLVNEAREVRPGLWVAGVDDELSGAPDVAGAERGIPEDAFVVGLFHSPAAFGRVAGRWPLALAGHTHGGQVRLPFLPPLWLPGGSGDYVAGWYQEAGSQLYVSRGVGTSIAPVRFLCRPEVALVTLEARRGDGPGP
jgi:predicted MPP superfamily phosphohydrolase